LLARDCEGIVTPWWCCGGDIMVYHLLYVARIQISEVRLRLVFIT
jgi:hypothetical protein